MPITLSAAILQGVKAYPNPVSLRYCKVRPTHIAVDVLGAAYYGITGMPLEQHYPHCPTTADLRELILKQTGTDLYVSELHPITGERMALLYILVDLNDGRKAQQPPWDREQIANWLQMIRK